jgi:hypothetical protein
MLDQMQMSDGDGESQPDARAEAVMCRHRTGGQKRGNNRGAGDGLRRQPIGEAGGWEL